MKNKKIDEDVLILMTKGMSNLEIADALEISKNTVQWKIKNILVYYDADNRSQAAYEAIIRGDVEINLCEGLGD